MYCFNCLVSEETRPGDPERKGRLRIEYVLFCKTIRIFCFYYDFVYREIVDSHSNTLFLRPAVLSRACIWDIGVVILIPAEHIELLVLQPRRKPEEIVPGLHSCSQCGFPHRGMRIRRARARHLVLVLSGDVRNRNFRGL